MATAPPRTRYVLKAEADPYLSKVNRITIRDRKERSFPSLRSFHRAIRAVGAALHTFVEKAVDFLKQGIHLLVIDLFPPTARDPRGNSQGHLGQDPGHSVRAATGQATDSGVLLGRLREIAYVEPIAVGDILPDMPLFLEPDRYVPARLEATYQATWDVCPAPLKEAVIGQDRADRLMK